MSRYLVYAILAIIIASCKKDEFLDANPDQKLIVPETAEELQALLDNIDVMNGIGLGVIPSLGEIGSDDYYTTRFTTTRIGPSLKNLYIWTDVVDPEIKFYDWDYAYRVILYANIALDQSKKISPSENDKDIHTNIIGSSLFFRSDMFYHLAQAFAPAYDESTSEMDAGIPLKLESDISEKVNRSSLERTYKQIVDDLKQSINYLPNTPKYKTRPSKPAAYAALARTYLSMRKYDSALKYSSLCLQNFNTLLDYNDNTLVNANGSPGIRIRYNPEVIFANNLTLQAVSSLMYSTSNTKVDSVLYGLYHDNDLRKSVFMTKSSSGITFKGSYNSGSVLFGGLAADEVYLIRAECNARAGNIQPAMDDLNTLMVKRWKASLFVPFEAVDAQDALNKILTERRKELIFRGTRWTDLRRLNKEGADITLRRILEGQTYTLPPNDARWTFQIPLDVQSFNPNWPKNPR